MNVTKVFADPRESHDPLQIEALEHSQEEFRGQTREAGHLETQILSDRVQQRWSDLILEASSKVANIRQRLSPIINRGISKTMITIQTFITLDTMTA